MIDLEDLDDIAAEVAYYGKWEFRPFQFEFFCFTGVS